MRKKVAISIAVGLVAAVGIFAAQVFAKIREQLRPRGAAEIAQIFFENDMADFRNLGGGGGIMFDSGDFKGGDIYFECDRPMLKNAAQFKEVGEKDKLEILKTIADNDSAQSAHFRQDKDVRIRIRQTDLGNAMLISNVKTNYCFFAPPGIGASMYAMGYKMRRAAANEAADGTSTSSKQGTTSSKQDR